MKKLFLILGLFLPLSGEAFNDPNNYLVELDGHLGRANFETAFKDNYYYEQESISCIGFNICDKMRTRIEVQNTGSESAKLIMYSGSSEKPYGSKEVKRNDWIAFNGNILRFEVAMAESFGELVTVDSLKPVAVRLNVNSKVQEFPGYEVQLSIIDKINAVPIIHTYRIVPAIPGIGQMAYRQIVKSIVGKQTDTLNLTKFNF